MSDPDQPQQRTQRDKRALGVQCACVTLVCVGAAYASYRHGRDFALRYGADDTTAAIWPLIVDGLMTTATVELWKTGGARRRGGRWSAWLAFLVGVVLSLCANIDAAPKLSVFAVAVAVCPPLALLLSVELLNSALKRHRAEPADDSTVEATAFDSSTATGRTMPVVSAASPLQPELSERVTAEQQMWAYYKVERAKGNAPNGADLDRFAGTNNYGRRVLQNWRTDGRIAATASP